MSRRAMMVAPAAGGGGGAHSHAYWRITMYRGDAAGKPRQGFSAMAFKDDTGSPISTSGGTAIESGHASTFPVSNLFDGVDSTYWAGVSTGGINAIWGGIQFTAPQKVRQIGLQNTANQLSVGNTGTPRQAIIEWSDDGVTWAPLVWLELPTLTNDVMTWFDFTNLITAYPATDFGSHAYWRALSLKTRGSLAWTAMSAMLFKDDAGSSIATTGGTPLKSAEFGAFTAANAFDSTDSTFWESSSDGTSSYLGYQFSSAKKVMQMGFQQHASTMDGSSVPLTALCQYSDDGVSWGTAAIVDLGTLTNDVPSYFNLAGVLPGSSTTFGSHAYWRVQDIINAQTAGDDLSAVLFKDDTGSGIASTGGTALESEHAGSNAAANAFDSTDATVWTSGAVYNPWVGYQFASGKTVMQMAVQRHAGGNLPPGYVWFEYSDDGSVWQAAASATPLSQGYVNDTPLWYDFSKAIA
jgi:hypothetical protein